MVCLQTLGVILSVGFPSRAILACNAVSSSLGEEGAPDRVDRRYLAIALSDGSMEIRDLKIFLAADLRCRRQRAVPGSPTSDAVVLQISK